MFKIIWIQERLTAAAGCGEKLKGWEYRSPHCLEWPCSKGLLWLLSRGNYQVHKERLYWLKVSLVKSHISQVRDHSNASSGCRESRLTSSSWQSLKHEHVCLPLTAEVPRSEIHFTGFAETPRSKEHIPSKQRATSQISKDKELYRNSRELGSQID